MSFDYFQKVSYFRFIPPMLPSSIILKYREKVALFVSITMRTDYDHITLKETLDSLASNFQQIHDSHGITTENILIIIQIEEIIEKDNITFLFQENLIIEDIEYYCSELVYKQEVLEKSMNILLVYKKDNLKVKMDKLFLEGLCNELRKKPSLFNTVPFFALFLRTGIILNPDTITRMLNAMTYSYLSESHLCSNNVIGIRGAIQIEKALCNYFTNIHTFEINKLNQYDLHLKNISGYIELNEEFFMLKVNDKVMNIISNYFHHNELSSYYLFYSEISFELQKSDFSVKYLPDCQVIYKKSNMDFVEWMEFNTESQRSDFIMSSKFLTSCNNYPWNIFNFYYIIMSLIKFIFPGLFIFILYTVYLEALGAENLVINYILLVTYSFVIIFTGFLVLIGGPKHLWGYYVGLYVIYSLFYLLFIVCSILAIHNLINKQDFTGYTFDSRAFATLIVVNVVLSLIPQFLYLNSFVRNIYYYLFYLLGACNYTSTFLICSIFNVFDNKKSKYKSKQVIVLITFLLLNCFMCFLIFFLYNRENRIQSIVVLSIVGTCLYFIKIVCVVVNFIHYYVIDKKKHLIGNEHMKMTFISNFGTSEQKTKAVNRSIIKDGIDENKKIIIRPEEDEKLKSFSDRLQDVNVNEVVVGIDEQNK
jgi:hypothetical protein